MLHNPNSSCCTAGSQISPLVVRTGARLSQLIVCAFNVVFLAIATPAAVSPGSPEGATTSVEPDPVMEETPSTASKPDGEMSSDKALSVLSARNSASLDDKQKLGVGDKVIFRVIEDREPPKSLTVTDTGQLDVPELGLVDATGRTCKQLALTIKQQLEQTTYYSATVILGVQVLNKTISGRKVYVVGEVRITGPQEIPAGETWTVSKAILTAGGFTDFANKKKVRLIRGREEGTTHTINVIDIWEKGETKGDLSVEPEDLIYVPSRAVNFY